MTKIDKHVFQDAFERPYYIITSPPQGDIPRMYVTSVQPVMESDLDPDHDGIDDIAGTEIEIGDGIPHIEYFEDLRDAVFALKSIQKGFDATAELQELLGSEHFPYRVERIEPKLNVTEVSDAELLVTDQEDFNAEDVDFMGIRTDPWSDNALEEDLSEDYDIEVEAALQKREDKDDAKLKAFFEELLAPENDPYKDEEDK